MNILLIEPPSSPYSWNQTASPPLGLLYLAAVIRDRAYSLTKSHNVRVLPLQLMREVDGELFTSLLNDQRPDLVGISTITASMPMVERLVQVVRDHIPPALIVLGGYQATVDHRALISRGIADIVVRGEGEITFCEIVHTLETSKPWNFEKILGITYKGIDGNVYTNQDRLRIRQLDEIPFPARDLVPMEEYKKSSRYRAGGVISSRGCPWSCVFCYSTQLWGKQAVYRSAKNVVDEIQSLRNRFGLEQFRFEDDTFTADRQRVFRICHEIMDRELEIEWEARSRADLVDDEILAAMKRAGLVRLQVGIETVDENSLSAINKRMNLQKYERFFELVRKHGINVSASVIIGLPNETPEQMLHTLTWIENQLTAEDQFIRCVFTPLPGTYGDQNQRFTLLSNDFSLYTMDIPLVVSKNFSYQQLLEIKQVADLLMLKHGPKDSTNFAMPKTPIFFDEQ